MLFKLDTPLKRILTNDVTKLLLFLVATFALAALLVPQVYNLGQFLAELTVNKSVNPLIDYLGAHARKADYGSFFNRSLYLAALILLPFLLFSLGARKAIATKRGPWSFALPARSIAPNRGQALVLPPHPFRQVLGGFSMGAVFLLAAGALGILLGMFELTWPSFSETAYSSFTTASAVAILEEVIFRGVILGIFFRTFRPALAIGLVAILFAVLHLMRPPTGMAVANPEGALAGFAFLELTVLRLVNGDLILQQWAPLFLAGVLLGITRFLTSSLWLPIGLHAGWVFAFLLFGKITNPVLGHPIWMQIIIGENLSQGLLPLAALGINALVIWLVYRTPDQPVAHHPKSPFRIAPS